MWRYTRRAFHAERARLFLQLRQRFHEHRKHTKWHSAVTASQAPQPATTEWRLLEKYWLLVFDEWLVTMQVETRPSRLLWEHYYAEAVRLILFRSVAARSVFEELFTSENFRPFRLEFGEEIVRLCPTPMLRVENALHELRAARVKGRGWRWWK